MDYQRFVNKVVNISSLTKYSEIDDLEPNDYILNWKKGKTAHRYCHFIDKQEQSKLIKETKLKLVKSFRADGKEGSTNQYLILQKI